MYYKLVLLFSSLIVGLIIVEITFSLLNIYNPRPPTYPGYQRKIKSKNFVPDQNVGWKMAPNTIFRWKTENKNIKYISNAEGFRVSKNYIKAIDHKHKKIVILGDSHFWGLGLENKYTLSGILSRQFRDAEVNNLAMPGFGLDQIYLSLLNWGIPENPDLVIAGIFTDNFFRSFTASTSF